jgi:hypothetical protein
MCLGTDGAVTPPTYRVTYNTSTIRFSDSAVGNSALRQMTAMHRYGSSHLLRKMLVLATYVAFRIREFRGQHRSAPILVCLQNAQLRFGITKGMHNTTSMRLGVGNEAIETSLK